MKILIYILLFIGIYSYGQEHFLKKDIKKLEARAIYKKGSIFVINPMVDTVKFSVQEVIINKNKMERRFNTGSFELDLSAFSPGDTIDLEIRYTKGYKPTIHTLGNIRFLKKLKDIL